MSCAPVSHDTRLENNKETDMNFSDSNQQTLSGSEPRLSQRTDPSWCNATNVIPFPEARASHRQPEKAKSRRLSLPLHQTVRKVKDLVLRLIRSANTVGVQRKRGATAASAAQRPEHHQPTPQHHGGSAVRKRMSA